MLYLKLLFSPTGRVGRKGYLIGLLLVLLIGITFFGLIASEENVLLTILVALLLFYAFFCITIKRSHDLGEQLEVEIQVVKIPIVGFIRSVMEIWRLIFEPGDENPNKYGQPPSI